jgi:hypothetical protein
LATVIYRVRVDDEIEHDEARVQARMKQIGYGKNTVAYDNYLSLVPKNNRRGYTEHPRTPNAKEKQSKRTFDGRIRAWRRKLHEWDTEVPAPVGKMVPATDANGEVIFPMQYVPAPETVHQEETAADNSEVNDSSVVAVAEVVEKTEDVVMAEDDEDDVL